jgi:hypothetical protein
VNATNAIGTSGWSAAWTFTTERSTSVQDLIDRTIPTEFCLGDNYPNPFNPMTRIDFSVPPAVKATVNNYSSIKNQTRHLTITVTDIQGRRVRTLFNGPARVGYHTVIFDGMAQNGKALVTGVYFCRMQAQGYVKTIRMFLAK